MIFTTSTNATHRVALSNDNASRTIHSKIIGNCVGREIALSEVVQGRGNTGGVEVCVCVCKRKGSYDGRFRRVDESATMKEIPKVIDFDFNSNSHQSYIFIYLNHCTYGLYTQLNSIIAYQIIWYGFVCVYISSIWKRAQRTHAHDPSLGRYVCAELTMFDNTHTYNAQRINCYDKSIQWQLNEFRIFCLWKIDIALAGFALHRAKVYWIEQCDFVRWFCLCMTIILFYCFSLLRGKIRPFPPLTKINEHGENIICDKWEGMREREWEWDRMREGENEELICELKMITRPYRFQGITHKITAATIGIFYLQIESTHNWTKIDKLIRHYFAEIFNLWKFHICSSASNRFCSFLFFAASLSLHLVLHLLSHISSIATESKNRNCYITI